MSQRGDKSRVLGIFRIDDLDGDQAFQVVLSGQVDRAHAAGAQHGKQFEARHLYGSQLAVQGISSLAFAVATLGHGHGLIVYRSRISLRRRFFIQVLARHRLEAVS